MCMCELLCVWCCATAFLLRLGSGVVGCKNTVAQHIGYSFKAPIRSACILMLIVGLFLKTSSCKDCTWMMHTRQTHITESSQLPHEEPQEPWMQPDKVRQEMLHQRGTEQDRVVSRPRSQAVPVPDAKPWKLSVVNQGHPSSLFACASSKKEKSVRYSPTLFFFSNSRLGKTLRGDVPSGHPSLPAAGPGGKEKRATR